MAGSRSRLRSVIGGVGALAAVAVLLSGCGSTSPTARSTPTPSGSVAAAQVGTTSGSVGVFLVDGAGRTLYVLDGEPEGTSGCYDECAATWPPLATSGDPTAAGDVVAKDLSTSTRTDGITQVMYGGRALYTYVQDGGPGQTAGQGLPGQRGTWWVVGIDAEPIKIPPSASATASSS
jgi:predicted lipoprotein with Yx(FWY)xxD motif